MKAIKFFLLIGLVVSFSACKDNKWLDLKDPDSFDESKFYRDSADIEGLLASAYSALRPAYNNLFFVTEMKSDNTSTTNWGDAGGKYSTFVRHLVNSSNDIVATIYNAFYFAIHRANLVIEHADAVSMSDAERSRVVAEAKFIRALSHFYLTRLWGPVTMLDHTVSGTKSASKLTRQSQDEVLKFVASDLQAIADGSALPANCTGAQFGHASKTAACALLGRVYLHMAATQGNTAYYQDAKNYLEKALAVSGYSELGLSYSDLFKVENNTNAEVIFAIMYQASGSEYSSFNQYFAPYDATDLTCATLKGRGFNTGQENLYNEFESTKTGYKTTDRRVATAIVKHTDGTYYTKKYVDKSSTAGLGGNLWYEIRFADVYLMLAEAYEQIEGEKSANAIKYLNKVRMRTKATTKDYATAMTDPVYAAAYPTLRDAIFHERRVELCFENQRWFDLQRLYPNAENFAAFMRSVQEPNAGNKYTGFQSYETLLPIPYDEVFINPGLGQNPGY